MITRFGKHGKASNFRKIVSATLLSALVCAFFVQAPIGIPALASTSSVFNNLDEVRISDNNTTSPNYLRSNRAGGMRFSADADAEITEIRWKASLQNPTTVKAFVYLDSSNKPGATKIGELTYSSRSSYNGSDIEIFTGSVEVTAGLVWIVFQKSSLNCSRELTSTAKNSSHQILSCF